VLDPLLVKYDFDGVCAATRIRFRISTEEAMELNKMRNFTNGFNDPNNPPTTGNITEIITKGASEIMMYLFFEMISSE
jgi:hypothetical protein